MLIFTLFALLAYGVHAASSARASFHVQYPWATRVKTHRERSALRAFDTFCGISAPRKGHSMLLIKTKTIQQVTSFAIPKDSLATNQHLFRSRATLEI
jgi:hypothetical protein